MRLKLALGLAMCTCFVISFRAQPVFAHAGQIIELTESLITSDLNAANITVGGSPVTVQQYSFDFSTTNSFVSNSTGWCSVVTPGYTSARLSVQIPNLEIGQSYYVQVCYKVNNIWYASPNVSSITTKFGDIYSYNCSPGVSLDLGEAGLYADDLNSYYKYYRFEFSTSSTFPNFPTSTSNPQGWYAEVTVPGVQGSDLRNSVANLEVGQHYWVRIRVRTETMTGWSQPSSIVKDFYTVNNKKIVYGNNTSIDLYTHGLTTYDGFSDYPYYRFEFSTPATDFSEYTSGTAPSNMYVDNPPLSGPRIGSIIGGLGVDKTYLCRVRVKTSTMQSWSAPGPTITLNTVNMKSFQYCGATLNIKTAQVLSTDYYTTQYYSNYKFEFCEASDFTSKPVLTYSGLDTYLNAPSLKQAMPTINHGTVYYSRVCVKTPNDNAWSLPGPVCSFITSACVPDPGVCPSYEPSCTYKPLNYYSFDNDCAWLSDCVGNGSAGNTYTWAVVEGNSPSQVGKGFDTRLTPTAYAMPYYSKMWFANSYPSNSNGDYTVEFCFKIGIDDHFTLSTDPDNSGNFYLPYFQLTGQQIRAIVNQSPYHAVAQPLMGIGRLSVDYYYDRAWHHVALRYNSSTKDFSMFIDGESPAGFQLTLPSNVTPLIPGSGQSWDRAYKLDIRHASGDLSMDEVAFYDVPLPDNVIYQHYQSFLNHQHYDACEVNPNITVPSPGPVTNDDYDPLEFTPGYDTDILIPGKEQTYMHCDLVSLPSTYDQIRTFPAPRYKPGNGLHHNINWTDTKYLGMTYSGNCSLLQQVFDPYNDINIQEELCKNWNYMFNVSGYTNVNHLGVMNNYINSMNSNYKLALITFLPQLKKVIDQDPNYINDINVSGINSTNGDLATPSSCSSLYNPATFPNPIDKDRYKLYGRAMLKQIIDHNITQPTANNVTALTRKIDYVSENGFETRLAPYGSVGTCLYSSDAQILSDKGNMDWDDYYGYVVGNNWYKAYANELIASPVSAVYDNKGSNSLFHTNTKFSLYLNTAIYGHNSPIFENYSTKRICNTPIDGMHYSTPNFYPWTGPYGWFNGASQFWGINELYYRKLYEIPLGDKLFAPFVSPRWGLDVDVMRPGQYLGFLKAIAMFGVDYYHSSYFNVTDNQNNWMVKRYTGDGVGFANDSRTWVWLLASSSYAQAVISRYEPFIRNGSILSGGKYGNEYYIVNKMDNANKYLIYTTMQRLANWVGGSVLSRDITLSNFTDVHTNFKVNARRQGSTYILDMTGSSPVFYQLDKWHQYEHPGYWTKDIDFEAEVDDSGNNLNLVTEFNSNISQGDYTDFTTGAKLSSSNNYLKYIFTPRAINTSNNDYQIWIRMKNVGSTNGKLEIKIDGVNTYIVDNVTSSNWEWYGYGSCLGDRMLIENLSSDNHTLVLVSGTDNLLIDQVCLKTNLNLALQTPPNACSNCCSYDNTYSGRTMPVATNTAAMEEPEMLPINVYPNPSAAYVLITSGDFKSSEKYTVCLINALGVEVKRVVSTPLGGEMQMETESVANGLYTLVVKDSSAQVRATTRLVVQH